MGQTGLSQASRASPSSTSNWAVSSSTLAMRASWVLVSSTGLSAPSTTMALTLSPNSVAYHTPSVEP